MRLAGFYINYLLIRAKIDHWLSKISEPPSEESCLSQLQNKATHININRNLFIIIIANKLIVCYIYLNIIIKVWLHIRIWLFHPAYSIPAIRI